MTEKVLLGKSALVTGAASGLGRAHAEYLAGLGANVLVNDLRGAKEAAEEIASEFDAQTVGLEADIGSVEAGQTVVDATVEAFGGLDIVVNNAGNTRDKMIFSMSQDAWDDVVRVHGTGTFAVCRAASAYFRERSKLGNQRPASIINTSSEGGIFGNAGQSNYAFAKGGIVGLSLNIHLEMAKYDVRCNVVCPRARTSMLGTMALPDIQAGEIDPLDVRHVSPLVGFLASDRSIPISGQVFVAYGGTVHHLHPPSWGESLVVTDRPLAFSDVEGFARTVFATEAATPPPSRHSQANSSWAQGSFDPQPHQ